MRVFFLFVALVVLPQNSCIGFVKYDSLHNIWMDQNLPDSIRFDAINKYYDQNTFSLPDSSMLVAQYHLDLAKSVDSKDQLARAFNEMAIISFIVGEIDSSKIFLNNAVVIRELMKDSLGVARLNVNIGNIFREQDNYQQAVKYFMRSEQTLLELEEFGFLGDVVNNIGLLYDDLNMEDLASVYFFKAMKYYKKVGLEKTNGNIWLNIGANYLQIDKLDSALFYLDKSYELLKYANNNWSLGDYYHQMAILKRDYGDFDRALGLIDTSLFFKENIGNLNGIASGKLLKAELLLSSNPEMAIGLAYDIIALAENSSNHSIISDAYNLMYQYYKKQNRIALALAMHDKYILYLDSLLIDDKKLTMVREVLTGEYEKKIFDTKILNQKNQNLLKLKQTHQFYWLLFFVLILFITILIFFKYRSNKYQQEKLLLIEKLEFLKKKSSLSLPFKMKSVKLNRPRVERNIKRKLNPTDWKVLEILLDNPVISNKKLAIQAHLSLEGVSSSLRRMYVEFDISNSKYMKIALILEVIRMSNS